MKVIALSDLMGTSREVHCPRNGFISYRYVLAGDGVGFSVHRTVIPKGEEQHWHYLHHVEACYCIAGYGVLTNVATRKSYKIVPGSLYVLDQHDDHTFQAFEEVTFISVFNPPCTGREVHDAMGSYPSSESIINSQQEVSHDVTNQR